MTTSDAETRRRTRIVVVLLAVAVLINYIDRSNMSVAAPMLQIELGLSATQLGFLLGAFFWSYTLMQMVVGWLVDHVGAGIVMAAGFLLWSLATSVTGLVHGFAMLFVARLVLGVGESVAIPGFSKILAQIVPEERRGSANSIVMAGLQSGPAVGTLAGGLLMARFGWRPFFIVLGLASLIWLPPWLKYMPREPARAATEKPSRGPTLLRMMRERSLWGSCFGSSSSSGPPPPRRSARHGSRSGSGRAGRPPPRPSSAPTAARRRSPAPVRRSRSARNGYRKLDAPASCTGRGSRPCSRPRWSKNTCTSSHSTW